MCGITGFNWDDKSLISRMTDTIKHRGPNDKGCFVDKNVSLGHRRLSIIDLSQAGHQPMFNEESDICIVFNGEIYNFAEIRPDLKKKGHVFRSNTDTEVIIHAYEEYGESCLEKFVGFFAFAIYDMKKKRLFLARDRIGKKPLYYYFKDGNFIFASELKAILKFDGLKKSLNTDALNNFYCFRYNPLRQTIFNDIYRLEPGSVLDFDLKQRSFQLKRYWHIDNSNRNITEKNESVAAKKILALFRDSVEKRLISDVPIGAFLSGGIDSSAVVSMMSHLNRDEQVRTFSVGFADDRVGNELSHAMRVAKLFDTDHREIIVDSSDAIKELPKIVWHLDEPMSDPAVLPNYILSREAAKKVTVILTGDGADELFAGYDQYKFLDWGNKFRFVPRFVRKDMLSAVIRHVPYGLLDKVYPYSSSTGSQMFSRFKNFIGSVKENKAMSYLEVVSIFNEEERKKAIPSECQPVNLDLSKELNTKYFLNNNQFVNNLIRLDMERYLPEDLLMKPDKMGMAFAIEARVPFLDHRLIDYSFTLPANFKLRNGTTKYIMKKAVQKILPRGITNRRKQPFVVPLDVWIEKNLKGSLGNLISEGTIIKNRLVKPEFAKKVLSDYSKSKMYYGRQIWSLANLEIWYRIFMEDTKPESIKI